MASSYVAFDPDTLHSPFLSEFKPDGNARCAMNGGGCAKMPFSTFKRFPTRCQAM
jgi:hypothetical protein